MYSNILVRFGELSTKGKNKMTFVRKLEKNIKELACAESIVEFDRIFLDYSEQTMQNLNYVFGIQSYSPVLTVESNMESIKEGILKLLPKADGKTFKVIVKRHDKGFEGSSMELNSSLGGFVLANSELTVDVRNPDIKVEIEIRKDNTYVFLERSQGLGGYPTGINGKVLHMMSGGIDSPIAALEMMKRGVSVDFLNFITPPHTDQKTIDKVEKIIKLLCKYQGKTRLYRSTYTNIMGAIGMLPTESYRITLMRRSFYRIASMLAKKNGYIGISNGENLGQVASQTLESMRVIQDQSAYPIYRPILTADKIETINKAIKVGTYDISIEEASETCEMFAPKAPVIKPSIHQAEELEAQISNLKELEQKNVDEEIEIKYL